MNNYISFTRINDDISWRAEDTFSISSKLPIFAIADGVTMTTNGEPDYDIEKFPTPPRLIANIFCSKTIECLENRYPQISTKEIFEAYNYANSAIKYFYSNNKARHEFGCTGAVVFLLKNKVIGSRFLDSGFALIRNKKIFFKTPEFWSWKKEYEPENPYPYINLNNDMSSFVQFYEMEFKTGDILVLFTDGYENHFSEKIFMNIFKDYDLNKIKDNLEEADIILSKNNHEKYGKERTLLMVQL